VAGPAREVAADQTPADAGEVRGRHASRNRRELVIDLVALVVLLFGLNLLLWGQLAQNGTVAVWVVVVLMAIRLIGIFVWRRHIAHRASR
jgi:hypothetical protein